MPHAEPRSRREGKQEIIFLHPSRESVSPAVKILAWSCWARTADSLWRAGVRWFAVPTLQDLIDSSPLISPAADQETKSMFFATLAARIADK
jgi:hypothetical protein